MAILFLLILNKQRKKEGAFLSDQLKRYFRLNEEGISLYKNFTL